MQELLVIGPRDSLGVLLTRRLQEDRGPVPCRQVAAPASSDGGASYQELLAGNGAVDGPADGGDSADVGGPANRPAAVAPADRPADAPADRPADASADRPADAGLTNPTDAGRQRVVVYRPPLLRRSGLPDLADAAALFAACAARPPAHLVLVSSSSALEPHHQNPGLLMEPPRPPRVRNPIARAWLDLEAGALQVAQAKGMALTVLRPAAVAARDSGDYLSRVLSSRLAMPLAGHDPSVQLLAPDDLAQAVVLAVRAGDAAAPGAGQVRVYHVAPRGVVPLRAALRLAGTPRLPVGRVMQRLARALPARLGRAAPIEQVDYLRYSVTVGSRSIEEELGFAPSRSSAAAVVEGFARPAASPPPAVPEFDDYGMDRAYIAAFGRTLFHFLHRHYWRIEVRGLDHVPRSGRAMLVGVHRGFMPWDGVMALHTVVRGLGRYPRFLIHPGLIKFPFLADYMTKLGGIVACQENADYVLGRDELVGMFPEGIQGAFTMYRDAYRLGKFGRDEFVKIALRNRAPLVPFVTAGSAEIFPIVGKLEWRWFRRLTEWPFLPVCLNFPLPGLPLPSKWHTEFLAPLELDRRYGPEAAQDAAAVREISQEVRGRMQEALEQLRRRRKSIFYGSIFEPEPKGGSGAGPRPGEAL